MFSGRAWIRCPRKDMSLLSEFAQEANMSSLDGTRSCEVQPNWQNTENPTNSINLSRIPPL